MQKIVIKGMSGVGKTLYAESLATAAASGELTVAISDHELFTFYDDYSKKLDEVQKLHENENVDISIIVVNDEGSNLIVDFGGLVSYRLAHILFPNIT